MEDDDMKDLTSSVYTFEDLIKGNYLYVDKTEYIWNLVRPYKGLYFLSRPRRFGKSLTISTLKAVFQGKKDLFKGLAIYEKEYDWKEYPVIHLDMGNCKATTPKQLEDFISDKLNMLASDFSVILQGESNSTRFEYLIKELSVKGGVVILLDEYDKPILNNATNPQAKMILNTLKDFYSSIKTCEGMERFVFITGVTKFSHVSLFSDLNNLTDITMDYDYATMLGYTQKEFETYFADRIGEAAKTLNVTYDELWQEIKAWYDGYRFEENSESVYNPVSLANFFTKRYKFDNYWFDTGTPSFLMEVIKKTNFDFENVLKRPVGKMAFKAFEIDRIDPLSLLLQTGYLTIKDSFQDFNTTFYHLDFPNYEVRSSFDTYLLNAYTNIPKDDLEQVAVSLARHVRNGNVDGFMNDLKSFLKKIPYGIQLPEEKYYQTIIFLVFLLLGIHVDAESQTSDGRIDAVAAYGDWIYLFEFKLNQSAEVAFDQIMRKEYFHKYLHTGKRTVIIGADIDSEKRQITDWKSLEITDCPRSIFHEKS